MVKFKVKKAPYINDKKIIICIILKPSPAPVLETALIILTVYQKYKDYDRYLLE